MIYLYTDGSGVPDGPGGWAYIIKSDGREPVEQSGGLSQATNNVAELTAVRQGLCALPFDATVIVVTDSQNVIGWLTGSYRRRDLKIASMCQGIDEIIKHLRLTVSFEKVAGHAGHPENERCDYLAGERRKEMLQNARTSNPSTYR